MINKVWVFLDQILDCHSPINPSTGMFTPLNHQVYVGNIKTFRSYSSKSTLHLHYKK